MPLNLLIPVYEWAEGGAGLGPPTELGAGEVSRLEESGRLIAPSTSSGYSLGSCSALQPSKDHGQEISVRGQDQKFLAMPGVGGQGPEI